MGPVWEWRWEYFDERTGRLEETPVWMTEQEALDWYAYEHPRSKRIDASRRDRSRSPEPLIDPPAGNFDWTRERRRRAGLSRYGLPPFVTPLYVELAGIWSRHRDPEVRRLALEIQTGRYALSELEAMAAEAYFYISRPRASVDDAREALGRIRRRLAAEMQRIGPINQGER